MHSTRPLPRIWAHAFLQSFSAVTLSVFVLGIAIVPFKAQDIWQTSTLSFTDCYVDATGRYAVAVAWTHSFFGRNDLLAIFPIDRAFPALSSIEFEGGPHAIARDPLRGFAYVGNADGTLDVFDPARPAAELERIGQHPKADVRQLVCSADGNWLVSISDDALYTWDLTARKLHRSWSDGYVQCVAITPDSLNVVCGLIDGQVLLLDLETGLLRRKVTDHQGPLMRVAICPQGRTIASVSFRGELHVVDTATNALLWKREQGWCPPALTFSPDGSILFSSAPRRGDAEMNVYNSRSGLKLTSLSAHGKQIRGASLTVAGELLTWGADGSIRIWGLDWIQAVAENPQRLFEPRPTNYDRCIWPRRDPPSRSHVGQILLGA